ncbi:kinase-like domain [Pyrenophora seminiperda CCB06]|uniref:Kinase-like domain n=1 Tax=Pyrenophora seminiperda CCB06 TaxID=1302712 RepID=A0A3M7MFK1_9PLEO|nr:kinase-like domain [Pyrenophora seminiperda CCB06]
MQDAGPRNLKEAYTDPGVDVKCVGRDLGMWLAGLHACSKDVSLGLPSDDDDSSSRGDAAKKNKKNNAIAVEIYRHSYNNLHTINSTYGSLLATDDECLCHGDFWPGNVLVDLSPPAPQSPTASDFELTRLGTSATDVGQFCAEAFLLDRFRGGRGLLPAFLGSYVEARGDGLDKEWVKRMVVHWAVHVAFWPTRVKWAESEAGTGELVGMGVRVLEGVVRGDWEGVLGEELVRGVVEVLGGLLGRP